jgi:DNA-binding response OmpR family regulator
MLGRLLKRDVAAPLPPGTPRILLVDDDEDEIALVQDALSRAGATYQVDWASTYEQGLDHLQRGDYEVGLVDYRLGSWTGLDFLREARDRGNHVPLIMLTGERDPAIDQAATGLGAVDFLHKGKTSSEEFERAVRFAAATGRALSAACWPTTACPPNRSIRSSACWLTGLDARTSPCTWQTASSSG